MWEQRSKITWLKEGDRNTRYFHNKASVRKKKNHISCLKDNIGLWQEGENRDKIILDYFTTLFTSSTHETDISFLDHMPTRVDEGMNMILDVEFTQEEVFSALKQMHPIKAPGPVGMTPIFFQKYWDVMGQEVTNAALSTLQACTFPPNLNHTLITLIQKKTAP